MAVRSFLRSGMVLPCFLALGLTSGMTVGRAEEAGAKPGVMVGKPAPLAGQGAAGAVTSGAEEAAKILAPAGAGAIDGRQGAGTEDATKMPMPGDGAAEAAKMLAPATKAAAPEDKAAEAPTVGPSGMPLPRFVSLKSDRVNVRVGPGRDYEVAWVFTRGGLPVEIVQEFENWRKIRDSEGAEGWVFHSLLSGRRTVLVAPWEKAQTLTLRKKATAESDIAALLEPGVLADASECSGTWCLLSGDNFSGWIEQTKVWGVYPNEVFD